MFRIRDLRAFVFFVVLCEDNRPAGCGRQGFS
jgi:hypothetical protein